MDTTGQPSSMHEPPNVVLRGSQYDGATISSSEGIGEEIAWNGYKYRITSRRDEQYPDLLVADYAGTS